MKHLETFERQWGILIKRDQEERSEGRQQSTVPFHSIRTSRVTGLSDCLKCHKCLLSHSPCPKALAGAYAKYGNLRVHFGVGRAAGWPCHRLFGRCPKPKFRTKCHMSHPCPNWMKWYSNPHGVYVLSVCESAEHNNFRNVLEGKKPLDLRGTLEIRIYGLIIILSLGARKNLRGIAV